MPGPVVVCVVAVIAGVAAGIAFKEFVYDPHLAPKIENWNITFAAYRRERRRKRASAHKSSHSHSDDGGVSSHTDGKSSVELESMVEREMQNFPNRGVLRHRKNQNSKDHGVEMLEKPNNFIPFEPLSPTRAPSASPPPPNPFASSSDTSLPIGRLRTPISDRIPSVTPPHATPTPSRVANGSPSVPPHSPSARSHESQVTRDFESISAPRTLASEYDLVHPSTSEGTTASTSSSRATTPFTDARSEVSFDFTGSEAELLYAADSDVELTPSHVGSDAAHDAEFLQLPRADGRSDSGSEDWERVSSVGR